MAISDPDPEARAKIIRTAFAPIADKLRQTGASVSIVGGAADIAYTFSILVTTLARHYAAVVSELDQFAAHSGGTVRRAHPADIAAGDPNGECFVSLSHIIVPRRAD